MLVPSEPKIYHIAHIDRLASIVADGFLWSDAEVGRRGAAGTKIGLGSIKKRRLFDLKLQSHPELYVGDCVPFYFCPRSVMLYLIYKGDYAELTYKGGQDPIIHLEADLHRTIHWAKDNGRRWAFTSSNAGSSYFEDFSNLEQLDRIDWEAVATPWWSGPTIEPAVKGRKQAEFLVEGFFPWRLVPRLGLCSSSIRGRVLNILRTARYRPTVEITPGWYY